VPFWGDQVGEVPLAFFLPEEEKKGFCDLDGRNNNLFVFKNGKQKDVESGFINVDERLVDVIFLVDGHILNNKSFDRFKGDLPEGDLTAQFFLGLDDDELSELNGQEDIVDIKEENGAQDDKQECEGDDSFSNLKFHGMYYIGVGPFLQ